MREGLAAQVGGAGGSLRAADPGRRESGLLLAAAATSILLHAVAVALGLLTPGMPPAPPAEQAVTVEILSAEEAAALTAPVAPPAVAQVEAPVASGTETAALPPQANTETEAGTEPAPPASGRRASGRMVRPTRMLSAGELADPRSAAARATLRRLDDADRMIQLCGIEAMAQVHAWREGYRPDRVVAYAGAEAAISGDVVEAGSAAFRNGGDWYALAYECRLDPDHATVTAFAFTVGDRVPREEWEARSLPDPALDTD